MVMIMKSILCVWISLHLTFTANPNKPKHIPDGVFSFRSKSLKYL